jgi:branched-chain amino acid transport system permease protein
MSTAYKVEDLDEQMKTQLAKEFQQRPVGHHSPELQRVLNVFRGEPLENKYVLICRKPHKEWVLGQVSGVRGEPVKILKDQVFTSQEDAEQEIFRRRWKKHTGSELEAKS